ncbi:MAG TPA: AmmeMemoRadiSam system protein A [Burkholderiaceae bacterium]|nr:AmmeMemoRadiSam system protein A [Burkholderiaceae bacterium]
MSEFDLGPALLAIARAAIADALGATAPTIGDHASLREPSATFVTLKQAGELRGCIGSVRALRPLADDVRANAVAAAFHDPRFEPLSATELRATSIEVSLLTTPEPIGFADENELLARLHPGIDGVILEYRDRRATFLPQVWDMLPDPRDFLAALKGKAGLSRAFWDPAIRASRYTVTKWTELPQ